jgi:hypothetical protein
MAFKNSGSQVASKIATIRHFYVVEPYRLAGIQNDLLRHALSSMFADNSAIETALAHNNPLLPYVTKSLTEAGFQWGECVERLGVFRWQVKLRSLDRADFLSKHS